MTFFLAIFLVKDSTSCMRVAEEHMVAMPIRIVRWEIFSVAILPAGQVSIL